MVQMQDNLSGDLHTCTRLEFLMEIDGVLCEVRAEAEDLAKFKHNTRIMSALNLLLIYDKTSRDNNNRRPQKFHKLRTFLKIFKFRFQSHLTLFNLKKCFKNRQLQREKADFCCFKSLSDYMDHMSWKEKNST